MKHTTLRRLAMVFVIAAAVSGLVRYSDVRAQQVGHSGVPGSTASSTCNATNNCAALDAANTFTANQTLALGRQWNFVGGDGAAIGVLSKPGDFYIKIGASYPLQVIEQPWGPLPKGIMIVDRGCLLWTTQSLIAQQPAGSFLCEVSPNVYSFGESSSAPTGWIKAAAIGNGAAGNNDLRGRLTLNAGTATYTFAKPYTVAPTCVATDMTATAPVQVSTSTTTLTLTGTGSDVLSYLCAD